MRRFLPLIDGKIVDMVRQPYDSITHSKAEVWSLVGRCGTAEATRAVQYANTHLTQAHGQSTVHLNVPII